MREHGFSAPEIALWKKLKTQSFDIACSSENILRVGEPVYSDTAQSLTRRALLELASTCIDLASYNNEGDPEIAGELEGIKTLVDNATPNVV